MVKIVSRFAGDTPDIVVVVVGVGGPPDQGPVQHVGVGVGVVGVLAAVARGAAGSSGQVIGLSNQSLASSLYAIGGS